MKLVKKSAHAPKTLSDLVMADPGADWEKFRSNKNRYKKVAAEIRKDQRGICAYCEIDLLNKSSPDKLPDFRIEHFYPKTPHSPHPNWAIDWFNLFGTCHGGSQRNVSEPSRFTAPDFCCDVPKANKNWTNLILNPLTEVPAYPRYFQYSESTGKIEVDSNLSDPSKATKASETINKLRLDSDRLNRMRLAVIGGLRTQISNLLHQGTSIEDASKELALAMFVDSPGEDWPAFFTCIRWYLGDAAEDRLKSIGYA